VKRTGRKAAPLALAVLLAVGRAGTAAAEPASRARPPQAPAAGSKQSPGAQGSPTDPHGDPSAKKGAVPARGRDERDASRDPRARTPGKLPTLSSQRP
jgi:hypothetical protein